MQQQPLLQTQHQPWEGRNTSYGSYEYNPQPTEDREDGIPEDEDREDQEHEHEQEAKISENPALRRIIKIPDYKPTPLRWPFIVTLAVLLCIAIGLIAYAQKAMPDSDSDAVFIGPNPTVVHGATRRRLARAVNSSTTSTTMTSSSATLPSGAVLIPTSTTVIRTTYTPSVSPKIETEVLTLTTVRTITHSSTSEYLTTVVSSLPPPPKPFYPSVNGSAAFTYTSPPVAPVTTFTQTATAVVGASEEVITDIAVSTTVRTIAPTVIPTYGEVTITYYETKLPPQNPDTIINENGRQKEPETIVDKPETITVINQPPPVVIVTPEVKVETHVFNQIETGTTFVGGGAVTNVVVITPTPAVPVGRVTTEGGVVTTVQDFVAPLAVGEPVTYTVVTNIGGQATTQVLVTTPVGAPFQPITYTTTRLVGGTPTVVTLAPPPTTFVTTIDGTPVTRVTTPPVTVFTTTLGGTLTTEIVVTTPTGTEPITLTFVSTSDGSLITYTRTQSPTTVVTTISGKLTTFTSTPSASMSLSTKSGSTRTLNPTQTGAGALPTVVSSTKVFGWGPSDLFVGTFLPTLFGIGLVILIRVIDLNAKLYQPFQSLAKDGGASGAESLAMQYAGVMSFITPAVTMLQGHPVPFITTIMVGCASFIVPLATEAIGLKLHGTCYSNTASKSCGPSLGISPMPANALIGLIAIIVIMLLLVLFFSARWPTGVNANPWSIAGIASLAGNPQVRIQQSSPKAIKKAVSEKQYGLGYYRNAFGQEEYGVVLMDESGRGLQDSGEIHNDSDGFDGATSGRVGSAKLLPFMPLRFPWRIGFILVQLGVLIFIIYYYVYYNNKVNDGGHLWAFMTSNAFGVRFVFAVIGVIIAFGWQSFFLSVSTVTPFQLMAKRTQPAARSILLSPLTNPFSGIYTAVKHRLWFLFVTSLAAIFSEFMPLLLANVPFSLAQPYDAAAASAIMSCIFLSVLIAVIVASFFVRYPPMPVDPRSIAGAMYYVSQSHMLSDFNGISRWDAKEREQRVKEMGRRYFYGVLVGGTWRRMGVDYDMGPSDGVVTAYSGAHWDHDDPPPDPHNPREV
ncbi:hypothetical protein B0T16DRAFT_400406 [Cercophora newfieldiana]|uniref:Zonadhesin n=1 Tax=Cercophora newfieldiana TaxID=92897 RepID=A0AA40D045_9PEZI|nr:hypothetical protein B0T16DRAFT_400406 [Cercophora newfieldiana]